MCSFYLNRLLETTCFQWWPLALHLLFYFYSARWSVKSLSETFVRGAGAGWFMCLWGEGRARLLDWARIFFPNLILWLIFPYFYFGRARSKGFATTLRNVSKLHLWDKIGHAKSVGFRFYSAIWRGESRISSRCLEITSISLIYSYSRKKELLFRLSRGLNRLTFATHEIRGDSELRY